MIYPVDRQIAEFLAEITNPETGELSELFTEEMVNEKLAAIQMDFEKKVEELRNEVVNSRAEAAAIAEEKKKLAARQKAAENRESRAEGFLNWLLQGEPFKKGACSVTWRKSEVAVPDDEFVEWAMVHEPDLLNYKMPEPKRADIKAALKSGKALEHVTLEQRMNIQVK